MADWRSLPRKQNTGRNIRRKNEREGPPGRPHRCPTCGRRLEYGTDMVGETLELVRLKGVRYLHECREA